LNAKIRVETSRGTYYIPEKVAADLLGSAIDGLAARLSDAAETLMPDYIDKDELADANVLKAISTDYADIYQPIIDAFEAEHDPEAPDPNDTPEERHRLKACDDDCEFCGAEGGRAWVCACGSVRLVHDGPDCRPPEQA
jgi:hypothetical protein